MKLEWLKGVASPHLGPASVLAVACSVGIWAVLVAGGHVFVPDDVYFYLEIADRIVGGQGSTFNGVVPTNGYHPLWMLVCVLLRLVVGASRTGLIRALFVVAASCTVLTLLALAGLLQRWGVRNRWVALGMVAAYVGVNAAGSEFHLSLLLLTLLVGAVDGLLDAPAPTTWRLARVGALAGLTFLARLDDVFVIAALLGVLVLRHAASRRQALRVGLVSGGACAAVALPYLGWNLLSFGALVPISGAVKFGLARISVAKLGLQGRVVSAASAFGLFVPRRRWALMALSVGCLFHVGYLVLRMENIWTWYFAGELLACAMSSAMLVDALLNRVSMVALAAATVLVLVAMGLALLPRIRTLQNPQDWYVEAGSILARTVPEDDVVATSVSPGALAWFSGRKVLAFDGLTLDYRFHHDAARQGLGRYLDEHHVRWLVTVASDSDEARDFMARTRVEGQVEATAYEGDGSGKLARLTVWSPILGRPLGTVDLSSSRLETTRFPGRSLALWKLPGGGS